MVFLGLDIGSSTIKGGVLDAENGTVSHVVREPFPPPLGGLPAGFYEVAPQPIVAGVQSVVNQLLDAAPQAQGIFVAGQMGGVMLVDSAGRPLTNYLSWRDQRSRATHSNGASCLSPSSISCCRKARSRTGPNSATSVRPYAFPSRLISVT